MLSLSSLKTYLNYHFATAEDAIKVRLSDFLSYVENEEAKEKAAVSLLVGKGFTVTAPAPEAPAVQVAA